MIDFVLHQEIKQKQITGDEKYPSLAQISELNTGDVFVSIGFMGIMVFNATFNNISVISWQLVLLDEEIRVPAKTTDL